MTRETKTTWTCDECAETDGRGRPAHAWWHIKQSGWLAEGAYEVDFCSPNCLAQWVAKQAGGVQATTEAN